MIERSKLFENLDSKLEYIGDKNLEYIFKYFNKLNTDSTHKISNDDICTPMECVKTMIDYIPNEFWERKNLKILNPCAGNGNFGAYCSTKTDKNNIWYNEINPIRYNNCKNLLKPKNIQNKNFFELSNEWNKKYDMIMANPPYSGGGNKNKSLSNIFIEKSIDMLNDNGYLCFITPNNWMTFNNNNTTLKKLLNEGSFIIIDNDAKKYFKQVGSSFTIFIWQKSKLDNKTTVINNYLKKDIQKNVILKDIPFIPLYISNTIIGILKKIISSEKNIFKYRCDLHNHTKKNYLRDIETEDFRYKTIHTPKKIRYSNKQQDIYDKWIIIFPLSTYYIPYIEHNVNVTQSVGYMSFETKEEALNTLKRIKKDEFKLIIHLSRFGNFNNIKVLKHMKFFEKIEYTDSEIKEIKELVSLIKY